MAGVASLILLKFKKFRLHFPQAPHRNSRPREQVHPARDEARTAGEEQHDRQDEQDRHADLVRSHRAHVLVAGLDDTAGDGFAFGANFRFHGLAAEIVRINSWLKTLPNGHSNGHC